MAIIQTNMLCSGYGKNRILNDISFHADAELTVIIGSNGSGKSTLLKSILGLCDIYSGSISLNQKDITHTPTYKITNFGISYMPQRDNVYSELSILENLTISNDFNKLEDTWIWDFFPVLKSQKSQKAKNLSGGQRQLLAMAMTIIRRPSVLLFDEPTANLSPKNANMVLDKIKEIQKELNNCVILVEQNVKNPLKICDMCYLFANGKIIYQGDAQTLLSDSDLAQKFLGVK